MSNYNLMKLVSESYLQFVRQAHRLWRLCLIMSEFQVISNMQGLSESNNKTVYFKPSLTLRPGIAQTCLTAFLKLSNIQLSKGKPSGLTWDQAVPSVGKGEKQGWEGESWETVAEDLACLCHLGVIRVTQHHLYPASPTSVSLTVQSSSINKPLEAAVLLPWQGMC